MIQPHRILHVLCACVALTACTGIPLRSIPELARLQGSILQDNPADFALAIQIDKRMVVTPQASPALLLKITPYAGTPLPAEDLRLPLVLSLNPEPGLPAAGAGRIWLTYTLPKESQQVVLGVRETYRKARSSDGKTGGVTIGVGIEQEGLAVGNPTLAQTNWVSWLRTSRDRGFFELWSGRVGDLINQAKH